MNSLKIKIIGLTAAIMVTAIALTAWHAVNTQQAMLSQMVTQNSRVLAESIRDNILASMAIGHGANLGIYLEKLHHDEAIDKVRIFDETGTIRVSANPEEIGETVATATLFAYRTGDWSFPDQQAGKDFHNTLIPLPNDVTCHGCHGASRPVLGILNLHLSLENLSALQHQGRRATIFSSLGMLAVLLVTLSVFILLFVDTPLRRLMTAMDRVERGDLNQEQLVIRSSREMSLLSTRFNRMVNRLRTLIETTVLQEREMAVAQEKLTHHDEIHQMNLTLEERLNQVEEANYLVADLASALEAKNTSLQQKVQHLSALNRIGLAINATMDLSKLFTQLIGDTIETLGGRIGYLLLLDESSGNLKIGGEIGLSPLHGDDAMVPMQPGGLSHWVIKNCRPRLITTMAEARDLSRKSRLGFERTTVVCAPLIIDAKAIGTLTVANKRDGTPFAAEDLELLATIAAQASIAINNARLYEDRQRTYLNTVQALVSAIEASDAYTRGHSERVTRYSTRLAEFMELSPEARNNLEQAAILHDIGKIGIDISLLHKEGALSSGDISALKEHPRIGVRILEPIEFLTDVRTIIGQHHERFDGKGYPQGISGRQLRLESRILAVTDTFDAITSDRPYRKALPFATALEEIRRQAGSQFDPAVVEAFAALCQQEMSESSRLFNAAAP